VKENAGWANLYRQAAKLELTTKDQAGNVVINAERYPKLAALDAHIARGQDTVDQIAEQHGIMTGEELRMRRNGPARIRMGAKYEKPTPGKMGVPSPKYLSVVAHEQRLEKAFEKATTQARAEGQKLVQKEAPGFKAGEGPVIVGNKVLVPVRK